MDVRRACFLPLYLAISVFGVACGSASATFEGGVFHGQNATFHVGDVPSEWHRVNMDDSALAFRDAHGSSILVSGRCDLKVDDVPLIALTNQLVMGTTERDLVKEETLPFDKREARHTVMKAKLDGVPLVWDVYVMKKNGCVYDMVYVAPPDRFDEGSSAFERFAASFRSVEKQNDHE
jgi:hypothetical protein